MILCASCHHTAHMCGTAIQYGRVDDARDMLALSYTDPKERRKARKLARTVAVEFAEQKDRGGPDTHTVMIPVPHSLFVALQILGKEAPGKLGVSRYIMAVMRQHARKNGHDPVRRSPKRKKTTTPNSPLSQMWIR